MEMWKKASSKISGLSDGGEGGREEGGRKGRRRRRRRRKGFRSVRFELKARREEGVVDFM